MIRAIAAIFIATCLLFTSACEQKEEVPKIINYYNVLFISKKPGYERKYIGTVKGLSSCKYAASSCYAQRRSWMSKEWDYVCCLRTREDECAREEKYEEKEK